MAVFMGIKCRIVIPYDKQELLGLVDNAKTRVTLSIPTEQAE